MKYDCGHNGCDVCGVRECDVWEEENNLLRGVGGYLVCTTCMENAVELAVHVALRFSACIDTRLSVDLSDPCGIRAPERERT